MIRNNIFLKLLFSTEGLDFFFGSESGARKLVEFIQSVIPIRYQHAKKLISHDASSNIYNYKYTLSVEVVPICKDNVVCLPAKLAHSLGGLGQICVVQKITSLVHLIDPNSCQCELQKMSVLVSLFIAMFLYSC